MVGLLAVPSVVLPQTRVELQSIQRDVAQLTEQIKNISVAGDLVVAISGSGNSENVIRAVETANAIGCDTLGLCGFSGGRLRSAAKHVVWVNVHDMQLCEDVHAIFGHLVMKSLCYPEHLAEDLSLAAAAHP